MASITTFAAFSSRGFGGGGAVSLTLPTGGNYIIDNNGVGKRVHVFTTSGTFAIPENVTGVAGSYNLEVLVVGGGQAADGAYGGGGGGGATFYTTGFRIGKGMSIPITVGGAGGNSQFYGLPLVLGGGYGGGEGNYSKGAPGGTGGGGSWHNGRPNGPYASTGNPAATWGTGTNPAGTYTPVFTITALGPSYAPYCTIARENTIFHSEGNGQYGTTSNAPNSALGNPPGGYYHHPNGFRARGGGGSAWHGGVGGEGVATKFLTKDVSWSWIGSGGGGKPGDNYTGRSYETNGYQWRDSIVVSGTYHANTFLQWNAPGTSPRTQTDLDNNVSSAGYAPAGYGGYGSAGSYAQASYNGTQGIIAIRYDLSAYPGGLAGATGNIFGGTIETSANGKYRYHFFTTAGENTGTSSNSQTWYISGDYRPQYFPNDTSSIEWPQRTAPSANTEPFYYYGDIPSTTFEFMVIGAGGGTGTEGGNAPLPSGYSNWGDAFHFGGGGSGGIRTGTFGRESQGLSTTTISGIPDTLANTDAGPTSRQTSGGLDMRPGFIEVYANSTLNPKLHPSMYEYSIARNTASDHRQQNGTIKIRGTFGAGTTQKAKLLRCYQQDELGEGVWGNDTNGSAGEHSYRAWYYFSGGGNNGNPDAPWGDAIYLSNNDYYFYGSNFTRVRAGSLDGTVPANNTFAKSFTLGNWTGGGFGQGTQSAAATASYWQPNVATGTNPINPSSSESYYNACRVSSAFSRYSIGNAHLASSWSTVWSKISTAGLTVINNSTDREFLIGANTSASGMNGDPGTGSNEFGPARRLWIQLVTETSAGAPSRRFEYMELSSGDIGSIGLPAGRRFVDTSGDGTSFASFGAPTRTRLRVYKWDLRRIIIRRLFVHDISVGQGGESWRVNPVIRRNGGPSYIFNQNANDPSATRFAGGGGSGGYNAYYSDTGTVNVATPGNFNGHGNQDYPFIGSGGGGAFIQSTATWQDDARDARAANDNGAGGGAVDPWGAGAGGGGAINTLDPSGGWQLMGGARGGTTSNGKKHNNNAAAQRDTGHGGSGYFGGTQNWNYDLRSISCESPPGVQRPQPSDPYPEYYYSILVDQYPHNAQFSAGGGGGATDNGNNASLGNGGSGGNGYTSSITGFSQVYGHGGGGWGRRRNGTPGNSMPANPATMVIPAGAPTNPEYYPYGGGGGWSAGRQEGNGVNASGYWPGNAPWPLAYDVSIGQDHMDAMRYWYSGVPAPQQGDLGSAYSGRQGVVIVAYDRAPFIYS